MLRRVTVAILHFALPLFQFLYFASLGAKATSTTEIGVAVADLESSKTHAGDLTANLRAKILDFRGLDSSGTLILRDGIPRPMGNFPENLSQVGDCPWHDPSSASADFQDALRPAKKRGMVASMSLF